MKKKIVILGAGIAGRIAYNALREHHCTLIDKSNRTNLFHDAVMRFRDPIISQYLGISLKEVSVRKEIFFRNKFYNRPSIRLNNLYSQKLYNQIGDRSLYNLGEQTRWIPRNKSIFEISSENFITGDIVCVHPQKIILNEVKDDAKFSLALEYDYCISTLPMPALVNKIVGVPDHLSGLEESNVFLYRKINVVTITINKTSSVNQTIYFPDPDFPAYRATLEGNVLKVELIYSPAESEKDNELIAKSILHRIFGITKAEYYGNKKPPRLIRSIKHSKISIGKIISIPEDLRLAYIMWLTDNRKILSFGRNAVWKPLRTDHLIKDIEKIKGIMATRDVETEYKSRLG